MSVKTFSLSQFRVRLWTLIKRRHTTLEKVAEQAEVSYTGLSRTLGKNNNPPTVDMIYKLAVYFGVSADYLLGMPEPDKRLNERVATFLEQPENKHIKDSIYSMI